MKHTAFLFIISALFLCFSTQPNSSAESCSFAYCYSNNQPTLVAKTQPSNNRGVFWQSKDGYCQAGVSAHRRTKAPAPLHATSYVQQNYSKFKSFEHSKEWHAFFTELTNVPPKKWTEGERKGLFYKFELYQHWTYKYFLQSFPEFEERIVELDKLRRQDKNFREKLNNHYMTYKWCGLKGDKRVAEYIREQLTRARKCLRDRQIQQELEEQNRIRQQKIKSKEPVRELFLDQSDEIDNYKRGLVENQRGNINESFCSRNQKRATAIQEAINNNFKISIQQYTFTDQAAVLLKQHNIDAELFKECIGNAIQQEIHQEFIDVLNNGANLYFDQDTSHLTDRWYGVLGNVSFIGSSINNIGHFVLAHEIADICEGLYQIEKRKVFSCFDRSKVDCVHIEELWNSALTCVGNALQKGGDNVVLFAEGIQDKAIGRPARFLTECACLLKNNPEEVFEAAGSLLLDSVQYVFDSAQLVEALATDPLSKRTFEFVSDFGTAYIEPVRKKVTKAALIFWQMPAEEKAQEVVALGLQVFAVLGAAKLIAALPAQAALLKTSALLKLDQLSQVSGPVMQTGVAPDGTMSVALQAVEQMSEELVAAAEKAIAISAGANAGIATTAVADAVSIVALAVRDGATSSVGGSALPTPTQIPDDELAKKIAENVEAIQRMKEQGIEVSPEYERLALEGKQLLKGGRAVDAGITHPYMTDQEAEELRALFIKEMGGEESLKKLGLEDAVIDKRFIKHVVSPEIKTMVTRAGRISKKLSGCHLLDKELLENGSLDYELLEDGLVKKVQIYCDGVSDKKTIFPIEWTKRDAIKAVAKTIKKAAALGEKITPEKKIYSIDAILDSGIKITTKLNLNKIFKTSYPKI